ncbi:hypothetical protein [Streptomyces rimosus]|uniref:hypothetical protein n=1 Tax=Streptomyces rimosus TaxID=1927 RepID=UPI00067AFE9C|nr:hypothetical protein [Streptomyces rimosus]
MMGFVVFLVICGVVAALVATAAQSRDGGRRSLGKGSRDGTGWWVAGDPGLSGGHHHGHSGGGLGSCGSGGHSSCGGGGHSSSSCGGGGGCGSS